MPFSRRRSRIAFLLAAGAALAVLVLARLILFEDGADRHPWASDGDADLLLVTVESLSASDVAADDGGAFPALAPFVRGGAACDDAVAASDEPAAALASILASARPSAHGVVGGRDEAIETGRATLAAVLKTRGFRTAAAAGSALIPLATLDLFRGFDAFDDGGSVDREPAEITAAAIRARKRASAVAGADERVFVWAHYGGERARADGGREIARCLAAFASGDPRPAILVLAGVPGADRGGAASSPRASASPLPEASVRAALVLSGPEGFPRGRCGALVSALDVAPSAIDALSLAPEPAFDGASVLPALVGDRAAIRGHAIVESSDPLDPPGRPSARAAVSRDFTYCDFGGEPDLRRRGPGALDRAEGEDESTERPDVMQDMRRRLRDPRGGREERDRRSRRGAPDPRRRPTSGARPGEESPSLPAPGTASARRALVSARAAARVGDYGSALDTLRDAIATEPDDPRLHVLAGELALEAGDVASAAADAAEALHVAADDPFAHALAARVARTRRDFASAAREFARVAELRPRSPGAAADAGRLLLETGEAAAAAEWLERSVRLDATSAERLVLLARSHLAARDGHARDVAARTQRAMEALRKAVDRRPASPEPRLLLARCLLDDVKAVADAEVEAPAKAAIAEAVAHLEAAAAAAPDSADAQRALGAALERAGSNAAAAAAYGRAAEIDGADAESLLGLARTLPKDRSAESRAALERAVAASPRLAAARRALGERLIADGDTDAGLRQLEEAAILDPASGAAGFTLLGDALVVAGRPHAAEDAYRRALRGDRARLAAIEGLALLLARGADDYPSRPREAVELTRMAVTMHSTDSAAWHVHALALDAARLPDEAVEARLREARLDLRAGRPAEALAALDAIGGAAADRTAPLRREAESLASRATDAAGAAPADEKRAGEERR